VQKIRALRPAEVVLAPDNDEAGVSSIASNFQLLHPYFQGRLYCAIPPKVRVGNRTTKDWNDLISKAGMNKAECRAEFERSVRQLKDEDVIQIQLGNWPGDWVECWSGC